MYAKQPMKDKNAANKSRKEKCRKVFNFVIQLYIIISIALQNYFSDLYPAKILDLSESFFPCR